MKQLFISLLMMGLLGLWAACSEDGARAEKTETAAEQTGAASDSTEEAANQRTTNHLAVSLWNRAGLRTQPGRGKDAEWITSINFGELVTYTGEEQEVASEDRTYAKVELADGKSGWVNKYLLAVGAMRAVALQDIEVYQRPDLTTYDGDKFEEGEIFAVIEGDRKDWVEVLGKEREEKGWIRVNQAKYKTDEIDVTVAILLDRAQAISDPVEREEALKNIAENSTFSSSALMPLVEDALNDIPTIPDLPANQLYIMTDVLNVRSEPDPEADNVTFQVKQGDICNILRRGKLTEIREMEDYWYEIEFNGQTGWVFGHFTSKRLEQ